MVRHNTLSQTLIVIDVKMDSDRWKSWMSWTCRMTGLGYMAWACDLVGWIISSVNGQYQVSITPAMGETLGIHWETSSKEENATSSW